MDSLPPHPSPTAMVVAAPARWWRKWWRGLSPTRQDRFAALAPLAAVLMFLAALVAAFWYFRGGEAERGQETLRRDVEYAQQRVRLRLLERQEQLMRIARDLSNQELERTEFVSRAESLISQYPELQAITWIDERRRIRASHAAPTLASSELRIAGEVLKPGDTADTFGLARDLQQPVYAQPAATSGDSTPLLQLQVPLNNQGKFSGVVLGEYSIDSLLRYGTPTEVLARYAVTLLDGKNQVLAGTPLGPRNTATQLLPWSPRANEYEVPVSPVGNGLVLKAQAYRTSLGVVGSGLFWLVGTLSAMTAWMLIATWRHTRRRMQAQQALVAETNFRRAMENSILTGMRALDMEGRITYVNAAFRQNHRGRLPGAGTAQKRHSFRCAALRVAPDRCTRPADGLDDLDDGHHRAQPHPRTAFRIARALHHRAGIAGRLGVRGAAGQRRTAVRQQALPPMVRLADRRPPAAGGAGGRGARGGHRAYGHGRRRRTHGPAHRPTHQCPHRERRNLPARPGKVARSTFALPQLGGRPTGPDGDCHRHHPPPPGRGAGGAPGRARPIRQPPHHHGRDGLQRGARIEPAAHGHQQLLQWHGLAHPEWPADRRSAAHGTAKDRPPGPARGPDHPAHPGLCEEERAQPHPGRRAFDGQRSRGVGRHRAAPTQRAPDSLCGRPPAARDGGHHPDRAGAGQPDEERRRSHPARQPSTVGSQRGTARGAQTRRRPRSGGIFGAGHRQGPGPRSAGAPLRSLLLHQGRRHGHGPQSVPQHRRVAPGQDACGEPLQWIRGHGLQVLLLAAACQAC